MALPKLADPSVTLAEFENWLAAAPERERTYELVNGLIVEKAMPTEEHALMIGIVIGEVYMYARARGIGLPGPEHRFRVPGDLQNSRLPDMSLTVDPGGPVTTQGATERAPDFIVEVKSPDETYDELRDKARWYVANGVRLVWLIFPRPKIVEVYRPDVPSEILTAEDSLEGYDVLPDFTLPVTTLFVSARGG